MSVKVVKEIFNSDRSRKIEIYERSSGSFGFEVLEYGEIESAWFPTGNYSNGFFETEEDAIREAQARTNWINDD